MSQTEDSANAIGDAVPQERDNGSRLQPAHSPSVAGATRAFIASRVPSPLLRAGESATHADEAMQRASV